MRPPYDSPQTLEDVIVHLGAEGSADGYPLGDGRFTPEGPGTVVTSVPASFPIYGGNMITAVVLTWSLTNYTWKADAILRANFIGDTITFLLKEEPTT